MDTYLKILHEFPFFGIVIGAIITGIASVSVFIILGRKMNPMYSAVVRDAGETIKQLISGHKEALSMQREHYEQEIEFNKQSFKKMELERNAYRDKAHEAAGQANALNLQIAELQARPDLDKVYEHQERFFTEMISTMQKQGTTMEAIHKSIVEHDKSIEGRTSKIVEPVKDLCERLAEKLSATL